MSLCSAKAKNPNSEVVFATNISKDLIPSQYTETLNRFDVKVVQIPFDSFVFSDDYLWSLAFYKLCVLKHLIKMDYNKICYMDSDVYVQSSFDDIWKECEQNILLYDINHGLAVNDYRIICDEFETFLGERKYVTHFGGEFFASSKELAENFVEELQTIYERMIENEFQTTKGDEFLLSLAADRLKNKVKNAGAYVYRFWTAALFRLVSTCYKYNQISVLHLPTEKNKSMLKLYDAYIKKGKIPRKETVWRKCHLINPGIINRLKKLIAKILKI